MDWVAKVPLLAAIYIVVKYQAGMDSVIRVHDNLDHFAAIYDRMSLGDVFAPPSSTLDFVLGGLPRDVVGSELYVGVLFGALFPLMWAMLTSEIVTRLVAFYGMRRLLRVSGLSSERAVYWAVPTLFSILPFFHPVVASVAGVPMLLSALIGFHRGPTRSDYLIMGLFPAVSWAGATIPYLAFIVGYAGVTTLFRHRTDLVRGVAVLVGAFAIIEWRLVWSLLAGVESHRVEIGGSAGPFDLAALSGRVFSLGRRLLELLEKHEAHSFGALAPLSVLVVVGVLGLVLVRRSTPERSVATLVKISAGAVGILVAAQGWPYVDTYVVSRLVDLPHFQMERIVWAIPGLSYFALAAAATALIRLMKSPLVAVALIGVFVVQGFALWNLGDFARPERAQLTVNEFYAPDVFDEVAEIIGDRDAGLVVSVGFHPHVALYNGFDTADGYWYNYPLEYKHRFRTLIAPALDADPGLAGYFDDWGSRAYLFQPVVGVPSCCEIDVADPYALMVDVAAFDDLGIRYVLSNGEILNAEPLGLQLLGETKTVSLYDIFVYATPVA